MFRAMSGLEIYEFCIRQRMSDVAGWQPVYTKWYGRVFYILIFASVKQKFVKQKLRSKKRMMSHAMAKRLRRTEVNYMIVC